MIERLTLVTGNPNKAEQIRSVLGGDFRHADYDLTEIQSYNLREIIEDKALKAFEKVQEPVLVDDTALSIIALNGFPGPLVKSVVEKIGLEGILKLLSGNSDRNAFGQVMFGLHDGNRTHFFNGVVQGTISEHPRGKNGFGWDSIFIPDGYTKTRAEMQGDEFDQTSPRIKALTLLQTYLMG